MNDTSFIGKILCAVAVGAALGWISSSAFGGLLTNSAATDPQILWVKAVAGAGGALIGGWLGWANAQLIITGAIFSTIANFILGVFRFKPPSNPSPSRPN